ncbi:PucR family transcriptional regulator [Clostridium sp. HBUAS56017]|uniref:PucR family transcriptional regulator n=1 Tax=Clostridium sp. HBUAS56017 TaxID=2571128 RepID=UPI001178B5B1|nr:PucR family transcriptional regulator [Clostridium sp. HBUAS56017]
MSISVRDIFKLDSLKKINLVAGETGLEKSIEWIYVAECFENPLDGIKWLQGGEIIIITGVGIKDNVEILLNLIKGISEKNGAGLIINIGPYIKNVSEEVIKLADSLELPLFTLPWEVKLVEVSRELSNAIVLSRIEENSLTHFLSNILFGDRELEGNAIEKAAYFGYNLSGECFICVIDIDGFERFLKLKNLDDEVSISKIKITFRKIVQDILEKHALKVPIIDKDDSVIIFNRAEKNCMSRLLKSINEIQDVLKKRMDGLSVSVGIGNSYKDLKMMKQSLSEAELAINCAKCKGLDGTITEYKDIGIYGLLFSIKNISILENYFINTLGPISNGDDNLLQILETYLNENCNITITAEKLFLHRNTLKYKIKKIEELLNCDLHNFDDCMKVKIALYINKILKK